MGLEGPEFGGIPGRHSNTESPLQKEREFARRNKGGRRGGGGEDDDPQRGKKPRDQDRRGRGIEPQDEMADLLAESEERNRERQEQETRAREATGQQAPASPEAPQTEDTGGTRIDESSPPELIERVRAATEAARPADQPNAETPAPEAPAPTPEPTEAPAATETPSPPKTEAPVTPQTTESDAETPAQAPAETPAEPVQVYEGFIQEIKNAHQNIEVGRRGRLEATAEDVEELAAKLNLDPHDPNLVEKFNEAIDSGRLVAAEPPEPTVRTEEPVSPAAQAVGQGEPASQDVAQEAEGADEQKEEYRSRIEAAIKGEELKPGDKDALDFLKADYLRMGGDDFWEPKAEAPTPWSGDEDPRYQKLVERYSWDYLKNKDAIFYTSHFSGIADSGYLLDKQGKETNFLPSQNVNAGIDEVRTQAQAEFARLYPEDAEKYGRKPETKSAEPGTEPTPGPEPTSGAEPAPGTEPTPGEAGEGGEPPKPPEPAPPSPDEPEPRSETDALKADLGQMIEAAERNPFARGAEKFELMSESDFNLYSGYRDLYLRLFGREIDVEKDKGLIKAMKTYKSHSDIKELQDQINVILVMTEIRDRLGTEPPPIAAVKGSVAPESHQQLLNLMKNLNWKDEVKDMEDLLERMQNGVRGVRGNALTRFLTLQDTNARQILDQILSDPKFQSARSVLNKEGALTVSQILEKNLQSDIRGTLKEASERTTKPAEEQGGIPSPLLELFKDNEGKFSEEKFMSMITALLDLAKKEGMIKDDATSKSLLEKAQQLGGKLLKSRVGLALAIFLLLCFYSPAAGALYIAKQK